METVETEARNSSDEAVDHVPVPKINSDKHYLDAFKAGVPSKPDKLPGQTTVYPSSVSRLEEKQTFKSF